MAVMSIDRLKDQRDISDRTKQEYYDVLSKTLQGLDKPIEWVILHPNNTMEWYTNNVSSSASGKLMIANAVIKMTRIYHLFAAKHQQHVTRWSEIVKDSNKEIKAKYRLQPRKFLSS